MSKNGDEVAKLIDCLLLDKAQALLEFARYLADRADEEAWGERFSSDVYHAKFSQRVEEARQELLSQRL